jgi:hypothetical protein
MIKTIIIGYMRRDVYGIEHRAKGTKFIYYKEMKRIMLLINSHGEFFEVYHAGVINKLLHFLGFALWGMGVGSRNWNLIVISPFIFESGHLINYLMGKRTKYDTRMIPIQIITWVLFILWGGLILATKLL